MSAPTNLSAGNNAFAGGAQQRRLLPPAVGGGGLPPADTGVGAPAQGVAPTQVKSALNNSTSNIGVPYSRLVPLNGNRNKLSSPGAPKPISETEDLRATRLAFVYGTRAASAAGPKRGVETVIGDESGYDARSVGARALAAPALAGPDQVAQLCSLEFLQQYFYNVLAGKVLKLDDDLADVVAGLQVQPRAPGGVQARASNPLAPATVQLLDAARAAADADGLVAGDPGRPDALAGSTLLNVKDFGKQLGLDGSDAALRKENYQGIFARDFGPMLKGKGGPTELVACTKAGLPQVAGEATQGKVARQPFYTERNLGDAVAFDLLEARLAQLGLLNYTPDGVVLSVGADDPSDAMSDEYLKARDCILLNLRIQGPAVCSTWSGDRGMEVLPLDRVFVIIVADVWFDATEKTLQDLGAKDVAKAFKVLTEGVQSTADRATYNELRTLAEAKGLDADDFMDKQKAAWKGEKSEATLLTNFRVRQTTSSQLVNFSRFSPSDTDTQKRQRVEGRSRMGLELNSYMGEYVVYGWQVGAVLDSSASRGSAPQSNLGVRTAHASAAHQLDVKIGPFSADRLARSFGNADGLITPRYVPTKPASEATAVNAQHPSKEKFNQAAA